MIRFLLKFGFAFTLLFAFCIALIRAQPYDDSELRAFLTPPEGCPAPCFMGIRPGVTTREDAIAILEAHEWVNEVTYDVAGDVQWTWSGLQLGIIDENSYGILLTPVEGEPVVEIRISTIIPIGYIYLLFGKTPNTDSGAGGREGIGVSALYFDQYMWVWTIVHSCPVTYSKFWSGTMNIVIISNFSRLTSSRSNINFFCG